jgi:hypothetical protein
MSSAVSRVVTVLALALAVFVGVLLTQYVLPPHIPRFRVETFWMWFLAVGILAVLLRPASQPGVRPASGPTTTPAGQIGDGRGPDHHLTPIQLAALGGILSVLTFLQYGAALRVGWLSDDFVLADWANRREWIHVGETGFVRPVIPMFWSIFWYLPFSWPATLHAVNLALHALNGLLIVLIALCLRLDRQTAIAAGLILVTFSAMSEAIVWISGMQDVMMTTLGLLTVLAMLRSGMEPVPAWASPLAIASAAVALGVKETAVAIPLLGWALAWATPEGIGAGARRRTGVVVTALAVLYTVARAFFGVSSGYAEGVSRYFFKQLAVDPFASLGEPWSAAWLRANPSASLSRGLFIAALIAAAFAVWRRRDSAFRIALASAAWVLVGVLPVFTFFHVSATLEGSRYLYLPAAGFSLLIASLGGSLAGRLRSARISSGLMAAGVLVLVVPSLAASRAEIARWTEAAGLRDRILVSYVRLMPSLSCGTFVAEGRVDNIEGAYVLRNGFRQALEEMGAGLDRSAASRCAIDWTDHLIVREQR